MRSFLTALTILAVTLAARAQVPSNTPCTPTTCPPQDQLGFPVGPSPNYDHDSNGVHFCSYPAVPGEDPNDFFCTYNDNTGALITDNDAGLCPPIAQVNCPSKRHRRDPLPHAPRVAAEARDVKAKLMKTRSQLAKKRQH